MWDSESHALPLGYRAKVLRLLRLDPYILAINGVLHNSLLIAVFYTPPMNGLQQAFYILGIIAFSVFLLIVIISASILYAINRKIKHTTAKARMISSEIRGIFESGRSYGRFISASIGSALLGKILNILRR